MKKAAYILTFLLLVLTVQPQIIQYQARAAAASMPVGCCKKPPAKNEQNKDCDKTATCNPFACYAQASYTTAGRLAYPANASLLKKPTRITPSEDIAAGFISECWNPPELISA